MDKEAIQKKAMQEKFNDMQGTTACQSTDSGAAVGSFLHSPARPSLRERIMRDLHRAELEHRKMNRLAELDHLLEKNPDIARILDLLEEVQGYGPI